MGRRTNERIDRIFKDLRANGKLDKVAIAPPKKKAAQVERPRPDWPKSDPRWRCCVVRHGDISTLWAFQQCHGCPLTPDEFGTRMGSSSGT